MNKLFSIALLLLGTLYSNAQIIQIPSQTDYCTNQTVSFSYTTPAPSGYHYEWQYEDYTLGWTPWGANNVINFGAFTPLQVSTGSIGYACVVRLLMVDDLTGQFISSDNRTIVCNQPAGNLPHIFHTSYSSCGGFEVPPPMEAASTVPNRWAMWYKNGIPTGISWYYLDAPADSAWYEYKVRLNCGDTMTTGAFFYQGPKDPILTAVSPTTICTGDSVELSLAAFETIDTWYKNGVAINGSFGKSSLKVGESGQYTAKTKRAMGSGTYCYQTSNAIAVTVNPGAYITGTDKFCSTDSVQLTCTSASSYQWKKNGVNIAGATAQSVWVKSTGNYTVKTTGLNCNTSPVKIVTKYAVPSGLTLTPSGTYALCNGNVTNISISGNNITTWQWQRNGVNMPGATSASFTATKTGTYRCILTNQIGCSKTSSSVQITSNAVSALPQKTIQLQPGSEGTDSYITCAQGYYSANYGNKGTIEVSNWYKYFRTAERGYLQFDLSQIPDYSAVSSADLSVFVDTIAFKNVNTIYPNSLHIRRNTQSWLESGINWNYAPGNSVYQSIMIPCSTITSSSFLSTSVTDLVRYWVSTPTQRFGLTMQLGETIEQLTWLSIASSDTAAPNYRPKLTVTYYAADINASGPTNLCTGGSVQFSTNAGAYTYQWYKNGVAISGATGVNYTATAAGDYHVVLTANSGCTARSLVKKVTVNGLPQINLTPAADSVSFCFGSSINLKVDSLSGYTFLWKRNNVNIGGAVYSSYNPTTTAWYTIKTTSNCGISAKDSVYVTRINNAAPVITAGGPTTFCAGQNVVLTSTTFSGATTQWYKNNVLTAGGTSYTATTAGSYYVVQTASGCSKTSNTITVIVNCREGEFISNEEVSMQVYPNPAGAELQVIMDGMRDDEDYRLLLTDLSGKLILNINANQGLQTISANEISDGVYLLVLEHDGATTAVKRVVIRH